MLQNIRDKSKSIAVKIIVGVIALTFVLWGAESLVLLNQGTNAPAEVNGEEVSRQALLRNAALQRRQILVANPDLDPVSLDQQVIENAALNQLIDETVMLQYANKQGLTIAESSVDQFIRQTTEFQVDGQFNPDLFKTMVRQIGLTPMSYRQQLKQQMIIGQLLGSMGNSTFSLPYEVEQLARLEHQKRDFAYLTLPLEQQLQKTTLETGAVRSYFDEHVEEFLTREQVRLEYLELKSSDYHDQITITDDELKAVYQQYIADFTVTEEREASHILLRIDNQQDQSTAMQLAEDVLQALKQGKNFTKVAKQYSQDIGSASEGGYLGLVQKGDFGGAFDTTLFALQAGTYSQPVISEFGVHVIYLHRIQKNQLPTFKELQKQLRNELLADRSEELFVSASETLSDISFSSPDLTDAADELGLVVNTTDWISRSGGSIGIAAEAQVIKAAFNDDVLVQGNNSQLIELSSDHALVVRVLQHRPPLPQEFNDVSALITTKLTRQEAVKNLRQQVETLLASLRDGNTIESVAQQIGLTWQLHLGVSRRSDEVSAELSDVLFALPRPNPESVYGMASMLNGDMALLQLNAVNEPIANLMPATDMAVLAEFLVRINSHYDQAALKQALTDNAEIIRN